ncbi:hypothetical protein ACIQAL_09305 [Pseudomonas sp. NPDC088368]|uniref:hypothetical protein n=1 Tax=Pseudomonas sp. NPDC088368 TaxID=3364453 RepID=UPI0037F1FA9B
MDKLTDFFLSVSSSIHHIYTTTSLVALTSEVKRSLRFMENNATFARTTSVLGFICLACVSACSTDLNAIRVKPDTDIPPAGAPYNLTFTQYEITVTRRVIGCTKDGGAGLEIAIDASVTQKEQSDSTRHYVIDLQSLQSIWKSTDIEATYYDSGALKAINASAEDHTGAVLVSAASTLGKIIVTAAAPAGPSNGCEKTIAETIAKIPQAQATVKAKTQTLDQLTADLKETTDIATVVGKTWGRSDRDLFADKIKALQTARREQAAANSELQALLSKVSFVSKAAWPPSGAVFEPSVAVPPNSPKGAPAAPVPVVEDLPIKTVRDVWGNATHPAQVVDDVRVYARLISTSPMGSTDPCVVTCKEDSTLGLKYRVPAPGKLLICIKPDCKPESSDVITAIDGPVSQLGHVFVLPLHSGMFTNRTVVAEFDDAGRPTKLGVKDTSAAAETAANSVGSIVDTVLTARAKIIPSKVDRIKSQTELLKAEAENAAARKALQPEPNAEKTAAKEAFAADTALLEAQVANFEANQALDAAIDAVSK